MVHIQVSEKYIHFSLMYMTDHIFPVLPIKHLVNQDDEPNMPHKLVTEKKPSVPNPHILFCTFIVGKATSVCYLIP